MVHTYSPSTWKAKAGSLPPVHDQPGILGEFQNTLGYRFIPSLGERGEDGGKERQAGRQTGRQNKQMTEMVSAVCAVTMPRARNLLSFISSLPNQNGLSSFKKPVT